MEPSSVELKVISCKDLKAFNFFQKLSVYTIVSIVSDGPDKKQKKQHQQHKTPIDRDGNGNPEWNHEMRFDLREISSLDHDHLFLEFDLLCESVILGDKTIGKVLVSFKDLIREFNGAVRYVSYEVRSPDGKPNGVLNFSYKVLNKEKIGSGFPTIENSVFPVVDPSPEVCYPTLEVHCTSPDICYPPLEVHYPSPEVHYPSPEVYYPSPEVHYPSPEFCYLVPLQPPPPPPPPHPAYYAPPPPLVHPTTPYPYGFESGDYSYPMYAHPTVEQLHPSDDNTWRNGMRPRGGGFAGSWNVR